MKACILITSSRLILNAPGTETSLLPILTLSVILPTMFLAYTFWSETFLTKSSGSDLPCALPVAVSLAETPPMVLCEAQPASITVRQQAAATIICLVFIYFCMYFLRLIFLLNSLLSPPLSAAFCHSSTALSVLPSMAYMSPACS